MRRIGSPVISLLVCGLSAGAAAQVDDAFPLRTHNPFLQIYGLPTFRTAELVAPGGIDFDVSIDIANDMDDDSDGDEVVIIDGETRTISLSLRRRFGERFEFGVEIPHVDHSEGFLDRIIYDFHDLVGLSNSTREGPNDQFHLYFEKGEEVLVEHTTPMSGIGDVQFTAAMKFGKATLRAGIKAPTGDPDKLTGSGATDFSLGIHGGGTTTLFDREMSYSGFGGILALGDGDVLPDLQRSAVPYGGLAFRWFATERFALATQLYAQGSYLDTILDEIGGSTMQLSFGGDYRFPDQGLLLRFAIAEDVAAGAAPDFAAHLSIRRYTR